MWLECASCRERASATRALADDSMLSLTFVAAVLVWSQPTLHRASPRAVLVQAQPAQHHLHVPPRARIVRAGGGPVEKLESVAEPKPIADALAGLTVGFSLLSKPIASSAIAGVDPLVGLWSLVVMGVCPTSHSARALASSRARRRWSSCRSGPWSPRTARNISHLPSSCVPFSRASLASSGWRS